MAKVGALELAMSVSLGGFQAAMNTVKKTAEDTGRAAERVTSIKPDTRGITDATAKLKDMQEQLKTVKTKQQTALIDGLEAEAKEARKEASSLRSKISSMQSDLNIAKAQKSAKVDGFVGATSGMAMPLVAAAGAGLYQAKQLADEAEKMGNLSQATGLTTQSLQEMQFIARQSGLEYEPMIKSVEKLQKNLGNEGLVAQLNSMGIAVKDGNGKFRDMSSIFAEVVGALGKMPEGVERNNLAFALFGKSSAEMVPMIVLGSDGIKNMAQQARDCGAVFSNEFMASAQNVDQIMDSLSAKLGGAAMKIGGFALSIVEAAAPAINVLIDILTPALDMFAAIPKPISAGILAFVGVLAVAGPIIKAVQGMIMAYIAYRAAVMAGAVAQAALNPVLLGSIAVATVVGIGVAAAADAQDKENDATMAKATGSKGNKAELDKVMKRAEAAASAPDIAARASTYQMPDTSRISTAAQGYTGSAQLQASGNLPGSGEVAMHIRDIREAVLRIMRVVEGSRLPVVTA